MLGSIITKLDLEHDKRDYENIYEYCSMCGKCQINVPCESNIPNIHN